MKPKIVVSLITAEQEFQAFQAKDARDTGARLDLDVEVLFAENNPITQIQQLFHFIHMSESERPAAILVETVSGDGLERAARNAVKAGMGWMLLNRDVPYVEALRREHPDLAIGTVQTDQEEVGRIQARQMLALLPIGGFVLYIQGPADTSVMKERLRGTTEAIAGAPIQLRIATGDWTEGGGEKSAATWLRLRTSGGSGVDLVAAQNDSMAIGARRVILSSHPEWTHVRFIGCDGLSNGGRKAVDERILSATITTPSNAGPALEMVSKWLRTGAVPPMTKLLTPRPYPQSLR